MREYELMAILPMEEAERGAGREKLLADLANAGVEIVKEEDIRERDLAYEINKRKRAAYLLLNIKADPAKIAGLDKIFKLNSNLIRYLFVNKEGSAEQ
ncbi:MAG: 30S ribosomal protein S6 [Termitinemataceae bacterium]|nr:MAG: 30S ribosomal protein S6 [Termitinemataceae bacterium]